MKNRAHYVSINREKERDRERELFGERGSIGWERDRDKIKSENESKSKVGNAMTSLLNLKSTKMYFKYIYFILSILKIHLHIYALNQSLTQYPAALLLVY